MTDPKQDAREFLYFTSTQPGWSLPPECTTGAVNFLKSRADGHVFVQLMDEARAVINMPESRVGDEATDKAADALIEEELDERGDGELSDADASSIVEDEEDADKDSDDA